MNLKPRLDSALKNNAKNLLALLKPQLDQQLIRVGGENDGGYVMLSPRFLPFEKVLSFGISNYSPWDLEIAEMGFVVHQWDGTISAPPDKHSNLVFHNHNVTGCAEPVDGSKNLAQILQDCDCVNSTELLLQIDIEGAEWMFFSEMENHDLLKFNQIIGEFHNLNVLDDAEFAQQRAVFEKINETHEAVYIHSNNYCDYYFFDDFSYFPDTIEITFVRRDYTSKIPRVDGFTQLNYPNLAELPDPKFIF